MSYARFQRGHISEAVPEEAVITDLVKRLPLSRSAADWAKEALDMIEKSAPRRSRADEVAAAGRRADICKGAGGDEVNY